MLCWDPDLRVRRTRHSAVNMFAKGKRLTELETDGARSYLDALSKYERVTQQAIALARRKPTHSEITEYAPRDLDAWPEQNAVRAVMLRWHLSLMAVLKTGELVFLQTLDLTPGNIAKESESP